MGKEPVSRASIRILVVEDEILAATDIMAMLGSFGYTAMGPVVSGEEAIVLADNSRPDIVLMDIRLRGGMDGIAAATEIKTRFNIPVIYITSHSDIDTIERVKKSEPYGYIVKPFAERDLYLIVELAVNKYTAERTAEKRENWFSTILRSIGDGVIVTDNNGIVTYINTAAEQMTGYSSMAALGSDLKTIFQVKPTAINNRKTTQNEPFAVFERQATPNIPESNILISKEGTRRVIEYLAASLGERAENIQGGVLVFRDITERHDAQEAIHQTLSKLRQAMSGTIEAMALTVETRDPYTAGHQRRVTDLARRIGEAMNLSPEEKDGIRMAGVIHDLGKISVPSEILSKPGKLSELEFNLIKIHPQVGYDILKNIDFPWPVADIIHQHHERIDGSGYPNKLRKNEILIESRVIAVADVVEAMASHRPYRASLGIDAAINEVVEKKGIFYDADVVAACQDVIQNKGFTF